MTGGERGTGLIREDHGQTRTALRVMGPVLIALAFVIGGVGLYYSTGMADTKEMGDEGWFDEASANGTKGFLFIAGAMLTFFLGLVLTKFGYMGAVARYAASEVAPVGTDTINYVGREAQPGLSAIGAAIGSGMTAGRVGGTTTMIRCHKCNDENAADAKFCDECGTALAKTKACTSCGELNDPDARFCDDCGTRIV